MSKVWTEEEKDRLLGCVTDEELKEEFPRRKISNLRNRQREFLNERNAERYGEQAEQYDLKNRRKQKSLYDYIGYAVVKTALRLPPPRRIVKPKMSYTFDEEEMALVFSDSQIGELTNPKETGGLGAYSTEIFLERLEFLKESLIKIFSIEMRGVPYNRINLFFLGDIIAGSTIFKGQLRSIDMTTVEQVMTSVDQITYLVAWLATIFPEVACYCVVGNHGRIGEKGVNSPMDNFDYLVYKWMQERLANYKNITVNVADTWLMPVERKGTRFVLVHGDAIRSWMNIPFYGAERSERRVQKLLNILFDYYVVGHHHQDAKFGNIIMNGCWPGGSELSLKVMEVGGLPSQKLFSFHPNFGITWSRDVLLVDPKKLKKIKIYK